MMPAALKRFRLGKVLVDLLMKIYQNKFFLIIQNLRRI